MLYLLLLLRRGAPRWLAALAIAPVLLLGRSYPAAADGPRYPPARPGLPAAVPLGSVGDPGV